MKQPDFWVQLYTARAVVGPPILTPLLLSLEALLLAPSLCFSPSLLPPKMTFESNHQWDLQPRRVQLARPSCPSPPAVLFRSRGCTPRIGGRTCCYQSASPTLFVHFVSGPRPPSWLVPSSSAACPASVSSPPLVPPTPCPERGSLSSSSAAAETRPQQQV